MATQTHPKDKDDKDEGKGKDNTVPGYAGEGKTTQKTPKDKPEGAVIGEGGSLTRPSEVSYSPASYKKPSGEDTMVGLALLEGTTGRGNDRKIIVDLTQAVTEEGAFIVFKAHFPDAARDGFKAKIVTKEEAEKLQAKWREEGAVPGQPPTPEDKEK